MKTVKDILGKRLPFSVTPDMTVHEVVHYLVDKGIGAVAVCDGPAVVGVFSERDLMRRVVHAKRDSKTTLVSDVMTKDVISIGIGASHSEAMALMLDKNFRHLAVRDEDGRFKGFVSMRELLELDIAEARQLISRLNDDYYHHEFDQRRTQ